MNDIIKIVLGIVGLGASYELTKRGASGLNKKLSKKTENQ